MDSRCRSAATQELARPQVQPSFTERHRKRLGILPVGDVPLGEIEAPVPLVSSTFDVEVAIGPRLRLEAVWYDTSRQQYRSAAILDAVAECRRSNWDRVLAVADVDLYASDPATCSGSRMCRAE